MIANSIVLSNVQRSALLLLNASRISTPACDTHEPQSSFKNCKFDHKFPASAVAVSTLTAFLACHICFN
jgi:hypothetical protein